MDNVGQTLTFRVSNIMPQSFTGPAGFGIDNISLQIASAELPEPASFALVALGLAGIGFSFRRKQ